MNLEVGMYVRTDKGLLGKLLSKENYGCNGFRLEYKGQYNKTLWSSLGNDSEVIKASHNIIDLIEVGDFVNGEKVIRIYEKGECYDGSNYGLITKTIETENDNYETIPHNHLYVGYSIKSIVTKEQFESMKYSLEG